MIRPGEYADTLRAVGSSVREIDGRNIGIIDHGDFVEVSWRGSDGSRQERRFEPPDLQALREWSQKLRGSSAATSPEHHATDLVQALRALGQELDERAVEEISIAEMTEGYWVSWPEHGGRVSVNFDRTDLMKRSLDHQARRTDDSPASPKTPRRTRRTLPKVE